MIVVSDTSCITNLIAIAQVKLLEQLFGEVRIPDAVIRELRVTHPELPRFLLRSAVAHPECVEALVAEGLGAGEAEAIVVAEELHAEYLLIDETEGRAVASRRGLAVVGLIGVLRRAKEAGLIKAIRPSVDALINEHGFWLSAEFRRRALNDAGESDE